MAADSLKKLPTDLVDNRNGYEEAVKDAEPPLKAFSHGPPSDRPKKFCRAVSFRQLSDCNVPR